MQGAKKEKPLMKKGATAKHKGLRTNTNRMKATPQSENQELSAH
jgi:hypothetical protein